MARLAKFIKWMDDKEQVAQLVAECIMLDDSDDIVDALEDSSIAVIHGNQKVIGVDHAAAGRTLHHKFDHFLDNDKSSRSDNCTWYQAMEEDQEDGDQAILDEEQSIRYNTRMPL